MLRAPRKHSLLSAVRSAVSTALKNWEARAGVELRAAAVCEALESRRLLSAGTPPDELVPVNNGSGVGWVCVDWYPANYDCNGNLQVDTQGGPVGNLVLGNPLPNTTSDAPVVYYNGQPQFVQTDISSNGFGRPWGQTRSWSAMIASGPLGPGWSVDQQPFLVKLLGTGTGSLPDNSTPDGADDTIIVITSGTSANFFDTFTLGGTTYLSRSGNEQLVHSGSYYTLYDTKGGQTVFYDMSAPTALQGRFYSYTDANGNTAQATYESSGNYRLLNVLRSSSGSSARENWVYQYDNVTYPTRVTSVTLMRSIDGGLTAATAAAVQYDYYDSSDTRADGGYLRTATTLDPGSERMTVTLASGGSLSLSSSYYYRVTAVVSGSEVAPYDEVMAAPSSSGTQSVTLTWPAWPGATGYKIYRGTASGHEVQLNATVSGWAFTDDGSYSATSPSVTPPAMATIDKSFYMYNKTSSSIGADELSYALDGSGFARAVADGYDPLNTLTADTDLKKYAMVSFSYNNYGRVIDEFAQGAGCSCTGVSGQGEYKYSYQVRDGLGSTGGPVTDSPRNTWMEKVTVTLPDDNQQVVYVNQYGQTMMVLTQELQAFSYATSISIVGLTTRITMNNNFAPNDVVVINDPTNADNCGTFVVQSVDPSHTYFNIVYTGKAVATSGPNIKVYKMDRQWAWYYRYEDSRDAGNDVNEGKLILSADTSATKVPLNFSAIGSSGITSLDNTLLDLVGYDDQNGMARYLNGGSGLIQGFVYGMASTDALTFGGTGDAGVTSPNNSMKAPGFHYAYELGPMLYYVPGASISEHLYFKCIGHYVIKFAVPVITGGLNVEVLFDTTDEGSFPPNSTNEYDIGVYVSSPGYHTLTFATPSTYKTGDPGEIVVYPPVIMLDPKPAYSVAEPRWKPQYIDPGFLIPYTTGNGYTSKPSVATTTAGYAPGYLEYTYVQKGTGGSRVMKESFDYIKAGTGFSSIYAVADDTVYRNADNSGAETTSYSYTWQSLGDGDMPDTITSTLPAVTVGENGSGATTTLSETLDRFGRVVSFTDAQNIVTTTSYDDGTGSVTQTIIDPGSGHLNLETDTGSDLLGRPRIVSVQRGYGTVEYGSTTVYTYNDAAHEVRIYPGWNGSTTVGPIQISREHRPSSSDGTYDLFHHVVYDERLTEVPDSGVSIHLDGSGVPDGAEPIGTGSNLLSLSRDILNNSGQIVEADDYFRLTGATYSMSTPQLSGTGGGTSNDSSTGVYHATTFWYDETGNLARTQTPSGTIYRTVYDLWGNPVSHWVGTDDTPTSDWWSPTNTAGTDLVDIENDVYDNGNAALPPTVSAATVSGGSGSDTVYYVSITWVDAKGNDTPASLPVMINVPGGEKLVVTPPAAPSGMTGYNVYASTREGTEQLQTTTPQGIFSPWTQPTGGVLATGRLVNLSGAGDGNLTGTIASPGIGGDDRITQYLYDFEDRQIAEKDGAEPAATTTHIMQFGSQQTSAVQSDPSRMTLGDVNGDGIPDAVVSNTYTGTISVSLSMGDGTFQTQRTYATASQPVGVSVGDLNNDGRADIAVAAQSGKVCVLLGNGDGTFQSQSTFAAGSTPNGIAVRDVNADSKLDIVIADNTNNDIGILLGNGNGTFGAMTTFAPGGSSTIDLTLADVNGDGKADILASNTSSANIGVLLGNGNGTFQAVATFAAGSGPRGISVADFNSDGLLDVALGNSGGSTASVLLGNGNGTFQAPTTVATGNGPRSLTTGDVDGDGKADIVSANFSDNTVSVLRGNGNGTFQAQRTLATGTGPYSATIGDLNGDGQPDITTANANANSISAILNQTISVVNEGSVQFAPNRTFASASWFVRSADVNGDGKMDLVGSDYANNRVSVELGNGDGTFQAPLTAATTFAPRAAAIGDLNGDGIPDLAIPTPSGLNVLIGNGNGTFQPGITYSTGAGLAASVCDINGDGKADVVITVGGSGGRVGILLGNGNGTFQAMTTFASHGFGWQVAVVDVSGDGKADIVTANYSGNSVSVMLGNGNGTFQTAQTFSAGTGPLGLAVADFNGDGKADVAVTNYANNTVSLLLGNGNGTLQARTTIAAGPQPDDLVVADMNGDGILDLNVANFGGNSVGTLLGNGNGTFQVQTTVATGIQGYSIVSADFNGDGRPDLAATSDQSAGAISVLLDQSSLIQGRPLYYYTLDNLNEVTGSYQYDGDKISLRDFTFGLPSVDAGALRGETLYSYDELGQLYQQQDFSIATNGTVGNSLNTYFWYDANGNLVKELHPGGVVDKYAYDAADRETSSYVTDGGGDPAPGAANTLSNAENVSGDNVLQQVDTQYDPDGNVIFTIDRERFHDDTNPGALGNPGSSGSTPKARDYYTAYFYDAADRLTSQVDIGTDVGAVLSSRPSTNPSGSLVTQYGYDSAGNVSDVTDPRGIHSLYYYDMLGRTTQTVMGHTVGGSPVASIDQTTDYTYDGGDNVLKLTAEVPGGNNQVTQYVYSVGGTPGVDLFSHDLISKIEYPDPSVGSASSTKYGWQTFGYNYQGDQTSFTDQNTTTHQYIYDVLDRLRADIVTVLGAGVDGAVRRLGFSFDSRGLPFQSTSYSDTNGANAVNQVENLYNGYGQLLQQYQEHSGTVNSNSLSVQYQYAQPSGANYSRLSAMIYPNGRQIDYVYNSGTVDDKISRVSSIGGHDGSTAVTLQSYLYLGLDTIVQASDGNGVALSYIQQDTLGGGDGGDKYTGLDRFGRVIDKNWVNGSGVSTDRFQYGYDADSNVLYQNNLVNGAWSHLYHANSTTSGDNNAAYDALNRLQADIGAGTLSSSGHNGSSLDTSSLSSGTNFTNDVIGNVSAGSYSFNSANQLTGSGKAYDYNGNMTQASTFNTFVYDAWNRVVRVNGYGTPGGGLAQSYQYDALGRRIYEQGYANDVYFDAGLAMGGNAIEERYFAGNKNQYVWGLMYQNQLVLRDDSHSSGDLGFTGSGLGRRVYVQQDADWNVTALVDTSGTVVQRIYYLNAYGTSIALGADFSTYSGPNYGWLYAFQGGRVDWVTGLVHFGARDFNSDNFKWMEAEPFGGAYVDGANLYQMERGNPASYLDPSGFGSFNYGLYGGGTMPFMDPHLFNDGGGTNSNGAASSNGPTTQPSGATAGLAGAATLALGGSAEATAGEGAALVAPGPLAWIALGTAYAWFAALQKAKNGELPLSTWEDPAYYTPWGRPEQVLHQNSNIGSNSSANAQPCPTGSQSMAQPPQQPPQQPQQPPRKPDPNRSRTDARNLEERLAMDEAKGGAGKLNMPHEKLTDPKYKSDPGWIKMEHVRYTPDGRKINIHYMLNKDTGQTDQFKFIDD